MAESSAKRRRVNNSGGRGEVPPPLLEYGFFSGAVMVALRDCNEDMLQRITNEYTVNAQTKYDQTLLMVAVSHYNVASVRFLIERGAAVNIQDNVNRTALHWLCEDLAEDEDDEVVWLRNAAFEETLVLLLRAGADTTLKNREA